MTLAAMVASCGLGQRVLGLLSVAEDSGGSDIAFGIVFFCGIGLYDPCGSGGMDETEHARGGVHLGNDARVTHSSPMASTLPKDEVALLQMLGVLYSASPKILARAGGRERVAELEVDVSRKTCTVERPWAFAAIVVRGAEVPAGLFDKEVGGIGQVGLEGHFYRSFPTLFVGESVGNASPNRVHSLVCIVRLGSGLTHHKDADDYRPQTQNIL